MNKWLADWAVKALTIYWAERRKLYCARWVRQVMEHAYKGKKCVPPSGLSAWQQFKWFKLAGYSIPLSHGHVIGDILYKAPTGTNPYGHVGIRIEGNRVAENSSVHAATEYADARGVRTLDQFGEVDGIIRIPFGGD